MKERRGKAASLAHDPRDARVTIGSHPVFQLEFAIGTGQQEASRAETSPNQNIPRETTKREMRDAHTGFMTNRGTRIIGN